VPSHAQRLHLVHESTAYPQNPLMVQPSAEGRVQLPTESAMPFPAKRTDALAVAAALNSSGTLMAFRVGLPSQRHRGDRQVQGTPHLCGQHPSELETPLAV